MPQAQRPEPEIEMAGFWAADSSDRLHAGRFKIKTAPLAAAVR
jgi:hypothetical protein